MIFVEEFYDVRLDSCAVRILDSISAELVVIYCKTCLKVRHLTLLVDRHLSFMHDRVLKAYCGQFSSLLTASYTFGRFALLSVLRVSIVCVEGLAHRALEGQGLQ